MNYIWIELLTKKEKRKAGEGREARRLGGRDRLPTCSLPSLTIAGSLVSTAMKVPTSKPSSAGAGPSSGSRWPPAGYVCCYTCGRWSRPSAVPLGSSPCEALSSPLGAAGLQAGSDAFEQVSQAFEQWLALCEKLASPGWLEWVWKRSQKRNLLISFFTSEIRKETISLSQKNWKFQPKWLWEIIYFVCVLHLKTGIVIRLVFAFCMFVPKLNLGHNILAQGWKIYLVWPIICILGTGKYAKILSPQPLTESRPHSHPSACRHPAPGSLVFLGYKRKHLLWTPPLCCFLLAPNVSLRSCDAGNQTSLSALTPPRGPASFLGSASLL